MEIDPCIYTSSAAKLCELIRQGRLTSTELLEAFIARVEAEPHINAVVVKHYAPARARAAAADRCWSESSGGRLWGRLHGLPMTVKEELVVEGICEGRVNGLQADVPKASCAAIQRLLDEGAIIFGKTNTPTWCKDWQTFNDEFGPTPNPHDRQRSCGGSSGGSCVAVACAHSPVELGADVAGSIRVPAAFCGVLGMQGTYGRIPTALWCQPLPARQEPETLCVPLDTPLIGAHVFKVIGPICKSAEDLALMNAVLERIPLVAPVAGAFRLALLSEVCPSDPLEPKLSDAVDVAWCRLRDKMQQEYPDAPRWLVRTVRKKFPENFAQVSYNLYQQILADPDFALLPEARIRRQWCQAVWNAFFDANGIDAVLLPISPTLPFLRNEVAGTDAYTPDRIIWTNDSLTGESPQPRCSDEYFYWPHFSILAQLPSISVPCGFVEVPDVLPGCSPTGAQPIVAMSSGFRDQDGSEAKPCEIPVGFQLLGRPHSDAWLVGMAAEIQRIASI